MPRGTMANSPALPLYDDFERLKYHSVALGASGTGSGSSSNNSLRVVIDHRAAAQLVFRRRSSISGCSMTVVWPRRGCSSFRSSFIRPHIPMRAHGMATVRGTVSPSTDRSHADTVTPFHCQCCIPVVHKRFPPRATNRILKTLGGHVHNCEDYMKFSWCWQTRATRLEVIQGHTKHGTIRTWVWFPITVL